MLNGGSEVEKRGSLIGQSSGAKRQSGDKRWDNAGGASESVCPIVVPLSCSPCLTLDPLLSADHTDAHTPFIL